MFFLKDKKERSLQSQVEMTQLKAFFLIFFLSSSEASTLRCGEVLVQAGDTQLEQQDAPPIQRYKYFGNIFGGRLWKDYYSETWLNTFVKENPTVERFLAQLPGSVRRSHTLGIGSKSTQFGSVDRPRIIMSNSDSTFLLTYSGDPNQRGYETLEVAIFDRQNSEFIPYEIKISQDGTLKTPEKNPRKCVSCHGESFRPIWSAYSFWPRFYGSFKDPSSALSQSINKAEKSAFNRFLENERNSGRYRHLIGNKSLDQIESLNSALTYNLARLNVLRIKKLIQKLSSIDPEIYHLVTIAVRDLADDGRPPADLKMFSDGKTAKLYEQEISRLEKNTAERLDQSQIKDIAEHLKALKMDSSVVTKNNVWTPEVGIWHHDANVVFHQFRTQEGNAEKMESYIKKIANLRFVVEILGNTSISELSMSSALDPHALPFYSTPLTTAWDYLLREL